MQLGGQIITHLPWHPRVGVGPFGPFRRKLWWLTTKKGRQTKQNPCKRKKKKIHPTLLGVIWGERANQKTNRSSVNPTPCCHPLFLFPRPFVNVTSRRCPNTTAVQEHSEPGVRRNKKRVEAVYALFSSGRKGCAGNNCNLRPRKSPRDGRQPPSAMPSSQETPHSPPPRLGHLLGAGRRESRC